MTARIGNVLQLPKEGHAYAPRPNSARILEVYREATVPELEAGLTWYEEAHAIACDLDPLHPERGAGVLAALSPKIDWVRNVALAYEMYDYGEVVGVYGANQIKARRIMAGEAPLEVLGGHKVRNFFTAINNPSAVGAVVIDRHAYDVAQGRVTNDESRKALRRVGMYERFAEAYKRAARVLKRESGLLVTPSQIQAVTWLVWRRLKGLP